MTRTDLSTLTSLWILIPLILILAAVAIFLNRNKTKENHLSVTTLTAVLLVIYLAIYFYLTLGFRRPAAEARIILTPLWSYREAIEMNPLRISRLGVFRQILLNILLTIPPGLLLPVLYRTKHPYLMTFLTILALSLVTESLQYFTHLGLCEIDDLINNLLGGLIGMGVLKIGSLSPKNTKRKV